MKLITTARITRYAIVFASTIVTIVTISTLATIASAQQQQQQQTRYAAQLQIDDLEKLAAKASQVVDVNVDERLLRMIPLKQLSQSSDQEERIAADLLKELKGVYVRSYEFDAPNGYGEGDASGLRSQLRAPLWTRIVSVLQKKEGRTVEVYLANDDAKIGGLAVMALEPRRLTIVNIVGNVDLKKLSRLEGRFGIPELNIGGGGDADEGKPAGEPAKKP